MEQEEAKTTVNDGGAAFPRPISTDGIPGHDSAAIYREGDNIEFSHAQDGMTLRDYFAAKALQGLLASDPYDAPLLVEDAYRYADAMLKEREAK